MSTFKQTLISNVAKQLGNNTTNYINDFIDDNEITDKISKQVAEEPPITLGAMDYVALRPLANKYKYRSHYKNMTEGLLRDGEPLAKVPKMIGIPNTVFNMWRKLVPEFEEAVQRGLQPTTYLVEHALLKLALGYTVTETTSEDKIYAGDAITVTKTVTKEIAPNLGAIQTVLFNRRGDKWKLRPEVKDLETKLEALLKKFNGVVEAIPQSDLNRIDKKANKIAAEESNWNKKEREPVRQIVEDELDPDFVPVEEPIDTTENEIEGEVINE